MTIEIETKPFSIDRWFAGSLCIKGKTYVFSLMDSEHSNTETGGQVISWCDETPNNENEVNKFIIEKYLER